MVQISELKFLLRAVLPAGKVDLSYQRLNRIDFEGNYPTPIKTKIINPLLAVRGRDMLNDAMFKATRKYDTNWQRECNIRDKHRGCWLKIHKSTSHPHTRAHLAMSQFYSFVLIRFNLGKTHSRDVFEWGNTSTARINSPSSLDTFSPPKSSKVQRWCQNSSTVIVLVTSSRISRGNLLHWSSMP